MAQPSRTDRVNALYRPVDDQCSICRDTTTQPVSLPCAGRHVFCRQCIDCWLLTEGNSTCPNCREEVLPQLNEGPGLNPHGNDVEFDLNDVNAIYFDSEDDDQPPPAPWHWEVVCHRYGWDAERWVEDGPHEVCSISYWIPGNHSESLLYGPRETIQERRQRVIQAWNSCVISQVRMQGSDDLPVGLRLSGHDCTLGDLKEAVLKA